MRMKQSTKPQGPETQWNQKGELKEAGEVFRAHFFDFFLQVTDSL